MRHDHRPLLLVKWQRWRNRCYIDRKIRPQFERLGCSPMIVEPQSLSIFGNEISAGDHLHLISSKTKPVSLHCWQSKQHRGRIAIGDYCLISPGVTIGSAESIRIGKACMIAAEVYISDCDWHGIYNRTRPFRCQAKVVLEDNVWLGYRSIITKGVTIGENSIVGAGAVVTDDVPANTIVAGNPARVVRQLNTQRRMLTREFLFSGQHDYWQHQDLLDEYLMGRNSWLAWIKAAVKPGQGD